MITCKILRTWFSTEMGEIVVLDRFFDAFEGGTARSVLAKHCSGKGPETLKRFYEKANLTVNI